MAAIFHGSDADWQKLAVAVFRNAKCDCAYDDEGRTVNACAGHRWLESDQRAMDGLVFMRLYRDVLNEQEGVPPCSPDWD